MFSDSRFISDKASIKRRGCYAFVNLRKPKENNSFKKSQITLAMILFLELTKDQHKRTRFLYCFKGRTFE